MGKRCLFSIGNGAEIQPLEKGRKCPEQHLNLDHKDPDKEIL